MGIAVGDATGDGQLDIVVTNFSQDFSTLYRGVGGGLFEDASKETGVAIHGVFICARSRLRGS